MRKQPTFRNSLVLPVRIVAAAAFDAGLAACATFASAQQELSRPRGQRRSLQTIHTEALRAQRLAESLAAVRR